MPITLVFESNLQMPIPEIEAGDKLPQVVIDLDLRLRNGEAARVEEPQERYLE